MMILKSNNKELNLDTAKVMGILNVTPDSFSDGGDYNNINDALVRAEKMIEAGVAIIDIGGESTRPGAPDVTLQEELSRTIPVIKAIRKHSNIWISIDTSKAEVMRHAIDAGVDIINDVRALNEPGTLEVASQFDVPVCLMHMQGQPRTMQSNPIYSDLFLNIEDFLVGRIAACENAGIDKSRIILDPGFGFGKSLQHNYQLLDKLENFHHFGFPLLVGMSRKSMLFNVLNKQPPETVAASVACATVAALKGAQIIRVHDFEETLDALKIVQCLNEYKTI